ncbi:retrovirus-related pol polyprotein from transposon TNT 1-94 [Tanacetum coccineum]
MSSWNGLRNNVSTSFSKMAISRSSGGDTAISKEPHTLKTYTYIPINFPRCPLTRITSNKIVPPKDSTIASVDTPTQGILVYSRRPKASRSVGSSSKNKILKSNTANSKEPNQSWGSTDSDVPSSSLIDCRFRNDHIAKIMGYGDYQLGNVTISWVYYVEGLGHNLFFVRQFCDSCLEVAFRKHTCFIRDLEGVDLLKGSRGKSKKHSHKPKAEESIQEKLYLLHMDLCGPLRVQSINGRKYILVIVDDYSQFTCVKFLRTKDEVPEFVIKFLKMIQVHLKATVRNIRSDNGTKFVNQTLRAYYEEVRISHQTSVSRSPQQNDIVERRNHILVEASRTMLIFSKALLFLWAEAVATACYTQNRSLIRKHHNKTPYELLHDRKPDLSYLHVFGALCYPTNDSEDVGKLKPKADIGIFVGYAPAKKAFRIYKKRTLMIVETINVDLDELTAMASEQFSSGPGPKLLTPGTISLGLYLNPSSSVDSQVLTVFVQEPIVSTGTPSSTTINQDAPSTSTSQTAPETPSLAVPLVEPKSYKDALTDSCWIEAMQEELNEFEHLEVKLDELGGVLKNKACLVERGYRQEEGIDFEESFALQFWHTIKKIQGTDSYEFLLANKKCVVNADVFRTILDICPRVKGVNFTDVPDDDTALAFLIDLGNIGPLYKNTNMFMDRIENVDYPELIWEDLAYQIDHMKEKKSRCENLPYPRFTKGKKAADTTVEEGEVSDESEPEPEPAKKKATSKRRVKRKVTISSKDNIISNDPDTALELGKSISQTKGEEAEAAKRVHATHARIVT